jgi:TonB family protein
MRPPKLRATAFAATLLLASATAAAESVGRAGEPQGSADGGVTPPKALDTAFGYPAGANGDATVVVELTVNADGSVAEARAVAGPEPFATAASRAAMAWSFEPARRGERKVRARIRVEVNFVGEHLLTSPTPPPPAPTPTPNGAPPSSQYVVTVRGDRAAPGGMSVTRAEARLLPGAFGDPFRAVEVQPGVTPVVSAIPFFFIRGAPPGNVGFLVDGVRVPLLFHALLGPAVLQPAFIDRIDVYKGGYPARYGRFAGGIVAAETVPPADALHAEGQLRLIDASAVVSTPLADGRAHVMAGGRYAFAGLILSPLTNAVLEYWDYQMLASYDLSQADTLGIFAFGALDYIGDDTGQNFGGTQFHRIDLREDHVFGLGTKLRTAATVGYDRSLAIGGTVSDRSVASRAELEHRLSEAAVMRTGADASLDAYALDLHDPTLIFRDATLLFPARTEFVTGAYLDFELHPEPWFTLTPGIRSDVFHSQGLTKVGVDPRIGAQFEVSRNVKLVHAFGIAHQSPNYVPNLPGAQVGGLRGGLQRSVQYSAGVEATLPDDITAGVTLFEHDYFNLSDPLGFSRSIAFNADIADLRATGYAYGAELSVRRSLTRRLGGLLSYTLSRSVRSRSDLNSLSAFDRTHVANVALGYDLGRRWRIGARGLFASGVPTRTLTGSGPKFGGDRAPSFFRLDLRVEKRWRLGAHGYWGVTAEVINATASTEVVGRQCSVVKCTQSAVGPLVLPSIGVEAGF